jgi:protein HIRA/HIR1
VLHLLGTPSFSAAALASGELLVYSPAGRRVLPALQLGHPACVATVHGASGLLVLTADGLLRLFDLQKERCELKLDICHLLAGGVYVEDARMGPGGAPLLTLSSRQTVMYHAGLDSWMVVAEGASLMAAYHSALPLPGALGPSGLAGADAISAALGQGAVAQVRRPGTPAAPCCAACPACEAMHPWGRGPLHSWPMFVCRVEATRLTGASAAPARPQQQQDRRYLEARIAVALQTKSAPEWRRWMICYARDLAASGDEGRLRELLGELLGPLRSGGGSGGGAAGQEGGWQPQVRRRARCLVLLRSAPGARARPATAPLRAVA